ncbi:hypothetical protein ACLOJK_026858, partial [Asimina triloba]
MSSRSHRHPVHPSAATIKQHLVAHLGSGDPDPSAAGIIPQIKSEQQHRNTFQAAASSDWRFQIQVADV